MRAVNGLPNLPGDKGYHTTGFDWGQQGNDETKMKDYHTAQWAVEQFRDRQFDKPFLWPLASEAPPLGGSLKIFRYVSIEEIILPKRYPTIWEISR